VPRTAVLTTTLRESSCQSVMQVQSRRPLS
jgi:hypothetical protein